MEMAYLQILGSPVDCLEGVIGAGMITFVRVNEQTQSPVALLNVRCLCIRFDTHNGICIRLSSSALKNPAFHTVAVSRVEALKQEIPAT